MYVSSSWKITTPTNNESPDQGLYEEDLLKEVEKLPPSTRQVFKLYAIEGYNHAEIGQQMGISEGTSKWHLSNARQILKACLSTKEYKHESKQQIK